jgi:hypothetical protein
VALLSGWRASFFGPAVGFGWGVGAGFGEGLGVGIFSLATATVLTTLFGVGRGLMTTSSWATGFTGGGDVAGVGLAVSIFGACSAFGCSCSLEIWGVCTTREAGRRMRRLGSGKGGERRLRIAIRRTAQTCPTVE